MAKRRERIRQCKQIREFIQDNKYTKALEMIDELPLEEVGSLDDLYLYAELYEKAERMEKKKEIFYLIYERTKSRHVLNKLLRLTIRLGDMEEARELYFTYEMLGAATLDTYELRYLLAKAEGEPRSRLIEILEDLKKEEYTEEWGFQLARLYEQEGLREKCIQECKDLKLWFGEGKIIDKALELQHHCEAPDWQPPVEEDIPEPEEPDLQEIAYAAPAVAVTEMEDAVPLAEEDVLQNKEKLKFEEETSQEQYEPEEEPQEDYQPEEFPQEKPQLEEDEQRKKPKKKKEKRFTLSAKKPLGLDEMLASAVEYSESVSEPVVVKKEEPHEKPALTEEQKKELLEEDSEDISERGIRYRTLKSTIQHVRYGNEQPHFVFAGGEERITLAVAKRITKELNHVGHVSAHSIVKITAEKLNEIDLQSQLEKIQGGCMLVTAAPELSKKAVDNLLETIKQYGDTIVIMLAGPFDEMDCFLEIYSELAECLTYKVRM